MPLNSDYPDAIDVLAVDDRGTGDRGTRTPVATVLHAGLRCRVTETKTELKTVGNHEVTAHTHSVLFPSVVRFNTAHRLSWADPLAGVTKVMNVLGTKRRPSASLPDEVTAVWYEAGGS